MRSVLERAIYASVAQWKKGNGQSMGCHTVLWVGQLHIFLEEDWVLVTRETDFYCPHLKLW